jgi:pimeloyl-ACP methyl ester carboxylesterase
MKNKNKELGIVFIHGAGLGGWIWNDVIKNISLPTICADYTTLYKVKKKNSTLDDYVNLVYKQTETLQANKVVVVSHSIGGVVGVELIKKLGDHAAMLFGICASIPKPGSNFVSTLPFPQKLVMPIVIKLVGTKPPESAIRSGLGSNLSTTQADKIVTNFQPESMHLYIDKTSHNRLPAIRTYYIRTIQDKEFGLSMQDNIITTLPHVKTFNIPSGHMPMLSHPELVSKYINEALKAL